MGDDLGRPCAGHAGFIQKNALDSVATPPSSDERNSCRLTVLHPNSRAEAEFMNFFFAMRTNSRGRASADRLPFQHRWMSRRVSAEEALFEIQFPTPDRDHAGCWGVGRNSFLSSRCVGRYTTRTIKSQLITT